MPLNINAISLAEKLRSPADQVSFLQSRRILPKTYTCPDCQLTCEKAKLKPGTNYFYFHCPGCNSQTSLRLVIAIMFLFMFMMSLYRTGTILSGKGIMLRTWVLLVYFFAPTQLTHQQLIHEVDLCCDDEDGYQLSTGTKTSTATTVFYHKIFRLEMFKDES